jgi:hypothetical protein
MDELTVEEGEHEAVALWMADGYIRQLLTLGKRLTGEGLEVWAWLEMLVTYQPNLASLEMDCFTPANKAYEAVRDQLVRNHQLAPSGIMPTSGEPAWAMEYLIKAASSGHRSFPAPDVWGKDLRLQHALACAVETFLPRMLCGARDTRPGTTFVGEQGEMILVILLWQK